MFASKTNKKECIQAWQVGMPWHLLQDDLTVLPGGLAGAGAVVIPLGQLAGIGHRAGEGLHQQHQQDQYDFAK